MMGTKTMVRKNTKASTKAILTKWQIKRYTNHVIETAPFFSFLLFLLFFNKKCKPLLDKPQTPGGSSIWIIEDHCVFLYSAI